MRIIEFHTKIGITIFAGNKYAAKVARKKANYPLIESLEIISIAAEGKALGRFNDVVVFVPMDVPGVVVVVLFRSNRRR